MVDDGEDKRAQYQRSLLHGAPRPEPRKPQPGELLMSFEHGQDVYRVELRDYQPYDVDGQIFQNGLLLEGTRFTLRALAERWAQVRRAREAELERNVQHLTDAIATGGELAARRIRVR